LMLKSSRLRLTAAKNGRRLLPPREAFIAIFC
jgi:hypothetical protein